MDTKTYLSQISKLNFRIKNKIEEINQLREMATSISVATKEVNVQSSGQSDKMGSVISKIVDSERELDGEIERALKKKAEISSQIETIPDARQYSVLYNRYVLCKDWNVISVEMGYTFRNVMSIHGRALLEFEKAFGKYYL